MEHTLNLTDQDLAVVSSALVELPFRVAAPLIAKINQQIAETAKEDGGNGAKNAAGEKA